MGFLRKITGAQAQVDAARDNANAQKEAAAQAARAQQQALAAAAKSAAQQQAQMAARSAAEQKAMDSASTPLGDADVQLDDTPGESSTAARARRKVAYGRNYSGGVGI